MPCHTLGLVSLWRTFCRCTSVSADKPGNVAATRSMRSSTCWRRRPRWVFEFKVRDWQRSPRLLRGRTHPCSEARRVFPCEMQQEQDHPVGGPEWIETGEGCGWREQKVAIARAAQYSKHAYVRKKRESKYSTSESLDSSRIINVAFFTEVITGVSTHDTVSGGKVHVNRVSVCSGGIEEKAATILCVSEVPHKRSLVTCDVCARTSSIPRHTGAKNNV